MPETTRHRIIVAIRPEDTIEPIDFLSCFPLKNDTLRDKTTGIPLETTVINTPKMLRAT